MSGLASLFPPPPPYYRKYTEEAWTRLREASSTNGSTDALEPAVQELAPPSPPQAGQKSYRNFGHIWNVEEHLPSLADSGIEQLYAAGCEQSTTTLVPELKRLLHSVLVAYLGLVQTLATDPVQFVPRVDALRTLFVNMHHLLNTYRPQQSKESLVLLMEDQIRAVRESAAATRATNRKIASKLVALRSRLPTSGVPTAPDSPRAPEWEGYDLDADLRTSEHDENAMED